MRRRGLLLSLLGLGLAAKTRAHEPLTVRFADVSDDELFVDWRYGNPGTGEVKADKVVVRHPVFVVEVGRDRWEFTAGDLRRMLGRPTRRNL